MHWSFPLINESKNEQDSSSGVSPGGDSPVTGSTHSDAMQQQIHQVLSTQGLRDGLTDD